MKKRISVGTVTLFVALLSSLLALGCSCAGTISSDGGNDNLDADGNGSDFDDGGDVGPGDDGGNPTDNDGDGGNSDDGGDVGPGDDGGNLSDCGDMPEETFGAEPNPTCNPIGGGPGYSNIILQSDPSVRFVVHNKTELLNALAAENSNKGDVIFVPDTASIDLTGADNPHTIPAGVILAGDRGYHDSLGGRIFRNRLSDHTLEDAYSQIPMLIVGGDNVRITGLRIEGPDKGTDRIYNPPTNMEVKSGIKAVERHGLEVDNCEFWGWSHAGVDLQNSDNSAATATIHHNYMHHCQTGGYGYGVMIGGGFADIVANLFDFTRHAVAAEGQPGERYNASYNLHLGGNDASSEADAGGHHIFDVHGYSDSGNLIAGYEYHIHHNTCLPATGQYIQYAVKIRAKPVSGAWIYNNRFLTYPSPLEFPIVQYEPSASYGNMTATRNFLYTQEIFYETGGITYQDY
jgi:hypothetical protein